jgi:hypothetical protein
VTTESYLKSKFLAHAKEHLFCSDPPSEGKKLSNVSLSINLFLVKFQLYPVIYFKASSVFLESFWFK